MKSLILLLSLLGLLPDSHAHAEQILRADYRERPPEMQVLEGRPSGALIQVLETAAQRLGARIEWRNAPFLRSLDDLRSGRIDLVPRVLFTQERKAYIHYLPAIGTQRKNIRFIVKPGHESRLRTYADLQEGVVGVKRGTVYFEPFDQDSSIRKALVSDDHLLASMFRAGRLDVLVVLDAEAIEAQFRSMGFSDYRYADYQHEQLIGNYFGASLRLYQGEKKALYDQLAQALRAMRDSGEIALIYNRYGLQPPDAVE